MTHSQREAMAADSCACRGCGDSVMYPDDPPFAVCPSCEADGIGICPWCFELDANVGGERPHCEWAARRKCTASEDEEITQEIPVETMAEVVRAIGAAEIRRRMAERMGVRS